ncbi:FAD-dependent oxidoreductase [Bacteroides oleiciplenus]|uniref:FAD-dependent oxidoreductase n=1 Tax=Bacteroides oleiciplenus TaxID=626931 RepID=A0A3E5BG07_9BACE|nr:FAD-dependent oxidoreductase [Bacteroides oleiciplenus]RGN36443.1 FAD-dependent oxidoreductase [Bacteroides oleiciplenus]
MVIQDSFDAGIRALKTIKLDTDLVVIGGGMAGVCTAIAAARAGIHVVLVQDRPVLGGNASSEVRLWILGATSHMGNNNRWAREGGIIDEILVENVYRNKEGNPVIFDTILLDKIYAEPYITLLLNTSVYNVVKSEYDMIQEVAGFCSQDQTFYEVSGKLFCDASGDGVVGYLAGAAYRVGAENSSEYSEKFAPDPSIYGELLGHSIYFYSKDTGAPVKYTPPAFALKNIKDAIPRHYNINADEHGCKFWWLEYGGRMDTIHDTEQIKWELWSVVYGIWDHIKNSGEYDGVENLTLEWVGIIPGKRESRRFAGLYTLVQQDIIEQRYFDDAVAFGGWAIDLHPADGVYSTMSGCTQYHSKGVYQIPYRCFVSRDVRNLYFAGRNISTSHVAYGSSRVMATSALGGQAVGMAAAQCIKEKIYPAEIIEPTRMRQLQRSLNIIGQSIPGTQIPITENLASKANITASSIQDMRLLPFDGEWHDLSVPVAQMLPMQSGEKYSLLIETYAANDTVLDVELRYSSKPYNYTPDRIAEKQSVKLKSGMQQVSIQFSCGLPADQYSFVTFFSNKEIKIRQSKKRYTGILSVYNKTNKDVNNFGKQTPPADSGIEEFEFWCPERRPNGYNIAMEISPALNCYKTDNIVNGLVRPTTAPNAWVASPDDPCPAITLDWETEQNVREIILYFDTDYDHAMESVQMGHPENVIPFCVRDYQIMNDKGDIVFEKANNYQTINRIHFEYPLQTSSLRIELKHPSDTVSANLFQIFIQ